MEDVDCRGLLGALGPYCDVATLGCVQCTTGADCILSGTGAVCAAGTCEGCASSADCTSPEAPVCDAAVCVGCASSTDCATSALGSLCVDTICGCASSADCTGGRVCEEGACVPPCATNDDCTDGYRSVCDTTRSQCVVCLTDADCLAGGHATSFGGRCLAASSTCGCEDDSHCTLSEDGHHCDAATASCACRDAADCPSERPVCQRWCRTAPTED